MKTQKAIPNLGAKARAQCLRGDFLRRLRQPPLDLRCRRDRQPAVCGGAQSAADIPAAQADFEGIPAQVAVEKAGIEAVARASRVDHIDRDRRFSNNLIAAASDDALSAALDDDHRRQFGQFRQCRFDLDLAGERQRFGGIRGKDIHGAQRLGNARCRQRDVVSLAVHIDERADLTRCGSNVE